MKLRLSIVVLALLAGCASPMQKYADSNLQLAEQGRLKWSEYYRGLYNAAANSSTQGRGVVMGRANAMIEVAQAYESQKITADQFAYFRREIQAAQAKDDDAATSQRIAAAAAAMRSMSESMARSTEQTSYKIVQPAPVTTTNTNCSTFGGQLNCTSTSR